jgi:hypothetical protein
MLIIVRLIPYVALSGALAYLLGFLPQSREYLTLVRETAAGGLTAELGVRFFVAAIYYLLFCFLVGKSLQDIVIDDAGAAHSRAKRMLFSFVFIVLFAIPIVILLRAIWSADGHISREDLAAGALALLVIAGIAVIALKASRSTLLRSRERQQYFTPLSTGICAFLIGALFVSNAVDVVSGSQYFGTFGIVVGTLAFLQAAILLLAHYRGLGYPVFSIIVTVLISGYVVSLFTGPRYLRSTGTSGKPIPEASVAFKDWLQARAAQITAYGERHNGKKYPIFIVAAQGGGYYAAYHSALFLARLQDRCPDFAAHTFGISAVSGGSLGAAVFTEAIRDMTAGRDLRDAPCFSGPLAGHPIEDRVRRFFNFDFLTPLVTSTLLFDIPSAIIPAIRLGPDRGTALQKSFEAAWVQARSSEKGNGFAENFYGRWKPAEPVPALFLNTTSVNLGIPNLISELDLRASSRYTELSNLLNVLKTRNDPDVPILQELQKHIGYSQLSYVNTLQFNKTPSFPLSFAVTSSARFPYVTPSSLIETGAGAENDMFSSFKYMQLLDGGMVDNSGLFTASEIKKVMDDVLADPSLKELSTKVLIELIDFSHEAVALYKPGDEASIPEALAPLAAFDHIRMSRRSSYEALKGNFPDGVHEVVLFDGAFNAPLSWSLSNTTKADIEHRAGGIEDSKTPEDNKLCCLVSPGPNASPLVKAFTKGNEVGSAADSGTRIAFTAKAAASWKKLNEAGERIVNRSFVANSTSFTAIIRELGYSPE